jgi:hypothetical protein
MRIGFIATPLKLPTLSDRPRGGDQTRLQAGETTFAISGTGSRS